MEKRLTAQGPKDRQSFTITIPIDWIKQNGLDEKRCVDLEIVGNKVILSSNSHQSFPVSVDCEKYSNSMMKVIPGLYRAGVDEIRFNFSNSEYLREITDICDKKLIGYEIMEQKKNSAVIKDITRESSEDFKVVFRRIFLLTIELSELDDASQVEHFIKNIKKLINYCQRILIKRGHSEFNKIPFYYLILDRLEKLNDEFKWIFNSTKGKKSPEFKEVSALLRKSYEQFYSYDAKEYNKAQQRAYELKNEVKSNKLSIESMHIHNSARLLNSLFGDIYMLNFEDGKNKQ